MERYSYDWPKLEAEMRRARAEVQKLALERARNAEDRAFVFAQDSLFEASVLAFRAMIGMIEAGRDGSFVAKVLGSFSGQLLASVMDSNENPDLVRAAFMRVLESGLAGESYGRETVTISQAGTPAGRA